MPTGVRLVQVIPTIAPKGEVHAMLLDVLRSMFHTDNDDATNGAALAEAVRSLAGKSLVLRVALCMPSRAFHDGTQRLVSIRTMAQSLCFLSHVCRGAAGDVKPQRVILGGYGFGGNAVK